METTNDYEDEEQDTIDEFVSRYKRPIFIRPSKNAQLKKEKDAKKIQKRRKATRHSIQSPKVTSSPLLLVQESLEAPRKLHESPKPRKTTQTEKFYEYGECVSGYRFIGTKKDFVEFETPKNVDKNEPSDNFDSFSFDRLKTYHDDRVSGSDYIARYWDQDKHSTALKFPIMGADSGDSVHLDDLTKERVQQFYLRSCAQLGLELPAILKTERLKWHPDRLIGRLAPEDVKTVRKITKLFQLINDLWESQ